MGHAHFDAALGDCTRLCNHEVVNTSKLIGTGQAARLLGVDRSTLSRWVNAGKITPAMRVPGYKGPLLFDPTKVRAFAESGDHDDAA